VADFFGQSCIIVVLQYAVLLVLSFIAQVAVATLAFTFHKQVLSHYYYYHYSSSSYYYYLLFGIFCRPLATYYPAPQIQLLDFGAL